MVTLNEIDYKAECLRIARDVGKVHPECEVATLDMVRLLIHEVDTLRVALGIPARRSVLNKLEKETESYD